MRLLFYSQSTQPLIEDTLRERLRGGERGKPEGRGGGEHEGLGFCFK